MYFCIFLFFFYRQSPLPYTADIFNNYVINAMAGLILEKVHYNCIQTFIRLNVCHTAQVRQRAKGYLFFWNTNAVSMP